MERALTATFDATRRYPARICRFPPISPILPVITSLADGQIIVTKIRPALVLELTVNLLLPWVTYRLAQPWWGETGGLIASAVPPVIWSLVELVRFRRADAVSLTVLFGIVLSIGALAIRRAP